MAAAQRRAHIERDIMEREGIPHQSEDKIELLRQQAFHRHLAGISIAELEAYSGIGPATLTKLRDANFLTLADVSERGITAVPGLGQKRLADANKAVRDLRNQ